MHSYSIRTAQSNLLLRSLLILLLSLGVLTTKSLHSTGGIDKFLFAGEEGMALGADFHVDDFVGRARGEFIPAGTGNRQLVVLRMNFRFQFNFPRLSNKWSHIGFQSTENRCLIYHLFRIWQEHYCDELPLKNLQVEEGYLVLMNYLHPRAPTTFRGERGGLRHPPHTKNHPLWYLRPPPPKTYLTLQNSLDLSWPNCYHRCSIRYGGNECRR